MKMNRHVELPLLEPLYSVYHNQGFATAIVSDNPSIRNWYLNEATILTCSRRFLSGVTTPEMSVVDSAWYSCPYFDKNSLSTQFTAGYINPIIRGMIDDGYYVIFSGVDDYFLKGKSRYKEAHFNGDGLICGYDQNNKTYCIYAYDSNFIFNKFWVPQKDFNIGRISMQEQGVFTIIYALKVKKDKIDFSPQIAHKKIKDYLDSNLEKYPFDGEGNAYGIVVQEYLAEYVSRLYKGNISYDCIDRRVFHLICEHKKAMLERIERIEKCLRLNTNVSEKYRTLVLEAVTMRALYASHYVRRCDYVLPIIKKKLLSLINTENELLTFFVEKTDEIFKDATDEF